MAPEGTHTRSSGADAIEVEGIKVAPPLTRNQAQTLVSDGLLADNTDGLIGAWRRIGSMWAETVEEARSDPGEIRLLEKVDGEWSFIETLRHLVFVTDAWSVWACSARTSDPRSAFRPISLQTDTNSGSTSRPSLTWTPCYSFGRIVRRSSGARFEPWEANLANLVSDRCQASLAWVPSRS